MSIKKIFTLKYTTEKKNFKRRYKYHNFKIYSYKPERELMESIRNAKDNAISHALDYPAHLWATRHDWYHYYPEMYNSTFYQVDKING